MDSVFYLVCQGGIVVIRPNILTCMTCRGLALMGFFYPTYALGRLEKKIVADRVVIPRQCTCIIKTKWIWGMVILFRGEFKQYPSTHSLKGVELGSITPGLGWQGCDTEPKSTTPSLLALSIDVVNRSPSGAGHLNKINILRCNWVWLQY